MVADIHALVEDTTDNDCTGLLELRAPVHILEELVKVKRLRLTRGFTLLDRGFDGGKAIHLIAQQREGSRDDFRFRRIVSITRCHVDDVS